MRKKGGHKNDLHPNLMPIQSLITKSFKQTNKVWFNQGKSAWQALSLAVLTCTSGGKKQLRQAYPGSY